MTNAIVPFSEFALASAGANCFEVIRANLDGEKITEFDLPQARVPSGGGKYFALTAGEPTASIEGVIALAVRRRAYWAEGDSPDGSPPDCASRDMQRGVGDPGGNCSECPFAEWGTGREGRGKACKERLLLFVIRRDDLIPLVVSVPPTGLGAIRRYRLGLKGSYWHTVTRLTLRETANDEGTKYSEIVPEFLAVVDQTEAFSALHQQLKEEFGA